MKDTTANAVVVATIGAAAVVATAYNYVKTVKVERAKRRKIEENLQLDLTAIRLAGERINAKVKAGDYDGELYRLFDDFSNEIEFQKIRIREI